MPSDQFRAGSSSLPLARGRFGLDTLYSQLGLAPVGLIGLAVVLWGDRPERLVMSAYLLGWVASLLVQADGDPRRNWQPALLILDLAMLFVLVALAWKFHRTWPIWAAAMQLIIVMSHMVVLFDNRGGAFAFYTVVNVAGYGVLAAIALGCFQAWRSRGIESLE